MTYYEKMPQEIKELLVKEIEDQIDCTEEVLWIIAEEKVNDPTHKVHGFEFRQTNKKYGYSSDDRLDLWCNVCRGEYALMNPFINSKTIIQDGQKFMI